MAFKKFEHIYVYTHAWLYKMLCNHNFSMKQVILLLPYEKWNNETMRDYIIWVISHKYSYKSSDRFFWSCSFKAVKEFLKNNWNDIVILPHNIIMTYTYDISNQWK